MGLFGKKKITVADATMQFYKSRTTVFLQNEIEAVENIFRTFYEENTPESTDIVKEVLPSIWALGIEPVRNLWGDATFNRVQREMLGNISFWDSPLDEFFTERFLHHTQLWRNGLEMHSTTEQSDFILRKLGKKPNLLTSQFLSTQLSLFVGTYWKDLQSKFKLV